MRSKTLYSMLFTAILVASSTLAATKSSAPATPVSSQSPFLIAPLQALHAPILRPKADEAPIPATELDLLLQASQGHAKNWSIAKAALVISGVTDEAQQKHYFAQLEEIAKKCKEITADKHTPEAKAKALGKFLHDGPMKAGYVTQQYDFRELLETGHYNCVSSAVLFNMMAARVGIEVRVVTTPIHVFSRALDFDVEPTSGRVFPLDNRTDRVLKMDAKHGGPAPYNNLLFRETNNLGLLATMYIDEGGKHSRAKKYDQAVVSLLKAACLDPKNPSIVNNLHVNFKKWLAQSKQAHQDSETAAITKFYTELLPPKSTKDGKPQVAVAAR